MIALAFTASLLGIGLVIDVVLQHSRRSRLARAWFQAHHQTAVAEPREILVIEATRTPERPWPRS